MKQKVMSFYVLEFLMVLTLTTAGCYAQTQKATSASNVQGNDVANKMSGENKQESKEPCDFSKFNTLKETPGAIYALPTPPYPKRARIKKIYGYVKVRVLINRAGLVEQVCKLEGNDILAQSAMTAARGIKVSSYSNGRRLDANKKDYVEFTMTYDFTKK